MRPSDRLRDELNRGRKFSWVAEQLHHKGWYVDRSQISRIASGHRNVSLDEAFSICEVIGVDVEDLK